MKFCTRTRSDFTDEQNARFAKNLKKFVEKETKKFEQEQKSNSEDGE